MYLGRAVTLLFLSRYATASARSDGLLLLFGGRDANSVVSNIFHLNNLKKLGYGTSISFYS